MSFLAAFVQSGSILLREGLEAMLIISALAAFLRRSGSGERSLAALWLGGGAALIASFVTALIFEIFYGGAHDDRIEAAVLVVASGLMLYMSGWLFLRQDTRAWKAELERNAARALSAGAHASVGAIAFLAVFREGAETILFLHATAAQAGGWSLGLISGLVTAAAALAALFIAMQKLALRLPLRPLFLVTSAFLFIMGVSCIGGAVQELQEQDLLPIHDVVFPGGLLSLPSLEAMLAEALVALVAMGGTLMARLRRPVVAVAPAE